MLEIENYILDAIEILLDKKLSDLKFNYFIEAIILENEENGKYKIEYNERIYSSIKAKEGLSLTIGDIVFVCVVNGDFSNKYIECKRP
ncbi:hypothetical protein QH639_19565 [Lysinibacillus sp. 1 U-2021]|uniref:hypothetical protein n=1 Tax=Lysinibacillus sp. 1 U-2021 TaxID=3039426 RepID=UPI0024812C2F|nr:hypothetical protein [Lysinibacillus sp. 1 U-2021]WGT38001.1 hypothetical protein QH639_19565 [Lysinibacillus sp. 1 U-2021]